MTRLRYRVWDRSGQCEGQWWTRLLQLVVSAFRGTRYIAARGCVVDVMVGRKCNLLGKFMLAVVRSLVTMRTIAIYRTVSTRLRSILEIDLSLEEQNSHPWFKSSSLTHLIFFLRHSSHALVTRLRFCPGTCDGRLEPSMSSSSSEAMSSLIMSSSCRSGSASAVGIFIDAIISMVSGAVVTSRGSGNQAIAAFRCLK